MGMMATTAGVTAGCLGEDTDDESDPEPVDLTDGQTCEVCGMVIEDHYGPAVQAFYEDPPVDTEGPVAFDSVLEFVTFDADQRARGYHWDVAYATDYTTVSYEITEQADGSYISTHAAASDFARLGSLYFVIDSDIVGAMGPDAHPFSDRDEAVELTNAYGGSIVEWATLGPSSA